MDLERDDPGHRHLFHIPPAEGGDHPEVAYFAGNSLGLQPKATRVELMEDLAEWARLGVEGHLDAARPWLPYHELLTAPAARLVGALPSEVVVMDSLTVDLHLLMVSFYRPAGVRTKIVIEDAAFPSDSYAVRSQARFHGLDPDETIVRLKPREGEDTLRTEDVLGSLTDEVALLLLGGVNYLTGELLDMAAITKAGREAGAVVGWDLAHAAGNVPLKLHEWGADFAAWCSYKYLNSGPGALAGVFVHERHHADPGLPRFEGWWSTEPATRFEMTPTSRPPRSADAWQVSNPPIFAMGPVRTSLQIFDEVGIPALRARSLRLTTYLRGLLDEVVATRPLSVITPREPERHGCQLSVRLHEGNAGALTKRLRFEHGVIADARQPDVVRFAPVPLYSTYLDCRRAAEALAACVEETR
ncbi:kynureninase [Actinoplanes sp. NPDC051513]|uniref:kynureninase n=1 Tax=Actinoplanes sp. NPDC051513 TaxID=3363908 RepID=UPI00379C61D9